MRRDQQPLSSCLRGSGFADAVEGSFGGFNNDALDAVKKFLVSARPIAVILKRRLMKRNEPH